MTNLIQTRTVIRALTLSTLLAAAAYAPAYSATPGQKSSPAQTQTAKVYDGNWSVVIITEKGTCDRSYRYPVRISDGSVGYAGQASFNVSGRVNPNGAVTVRVSRGDRSASGSGRLSGDYGEGSWSGGECSGTWQAERRS
jgi:hypothetical protein